MRESSQLQCSTNSSSHCLAHIRTSHHLRCSHKGSCSERGIVPYSIDKAHPPGLSLLHFLRSSRRSLRLWLLRLESLLECTSLLKIDWSPSSHNICKSRHINLLAIEPVKAAEH